MEMKGERADHVITGFGLSKNLILSIHLNTKLQRVFYLAQENLAISL